MTACRTSCGEATVSFKHIERLFPFGHFRDSVRAILLLLLLFSTDVRPSPLDYFSCRAFTQTSKIDHISACSMRNTMEVQTGPLTQKRILSVPCPVCRAKPKEKCTLTTGHPSDKTHLDRGLAAAKAPPPASSVRAALRSVRTLTGHGLRVLFHHK